MPVAATITVNDRATPTPVAHNYAPQGFPSSDGSVFGFKEAGSTPIGGATMTLRHQEKNGKFYKRMLVVVPVVATETINGISVPKVVRNALIDCNFRFDSTSTEQERADAVGMFYNMLASSQTVVNGAIVKLERIWG